MLPSDWAYKQLQDITKEKISYGIVQAGPHIEDGIPYIKSTDVRGHFDVESLKKTSQEIHTKYHRSAVHPGDIVFSLRGNIGQASIIPPTLPEANLTQGTDRISVSIDHSNLYAFYQLASTPILNKINSLSKGSTFQEISLGELRKVKIPIAPLQEQTKIAQILSTWDQAIETTEKLIENSKAQKKALMQQLLTGKKRLPGFSGEWHEYHLGELFTERKENNRLDLRQLSITQDRGVLYRDDVGRKDTSSEDKSKYKRLCPNDIGYNTMRMWQGVSALSDKDGIVSPAYTVVVPGEKSHAVYMSYLFKLPKTVHDFYRYSQGLVSDTWNLKFPNFSEVKVTVPTYEEQARIANVLQTADMQIENLIQQKEKLQQEKKALMQQLLTGKRRVKVDQ